MNAVKGILLSKTALLELCLLLFVYNCLVSRKVIVLFTVDNSSIQNSQFLFEFYLSHDPVHPLQWCIFGFFWWWNRVSPPVTEQQICRLDPRPWWAPQVDTLLAQGRIKFPCGSANNAGPDWSPQEKLICEIRPGFLAFRQKPEHKPACTGQLDYVATHDFMKKKEHLNRDLITWPQCRDF